MAATRGKVALAQNGTPQKYISKVGIFFAARKHGVNAPRFATNPPQINHQKTTSCTRFFSKAPEKPPLHHAKKFS
jgi:hypothetical protein